MGLLQNTCTVALMAGGIAGCSPSQRPELGLTDHIVIAKSAHTLTLEGKGHVLRTYKVALGRGGLDAKNRQGDHRTPEGEYRVDGKNASSRFHKALHLSYPNHEDSRYAVAMHVSPGGDIEIHGLQNGLGWIGAAEHWLDWTDGCIALSDSQIDELWQAVPIGTPVTIKH